MEWEADRIVALRKHAGMTQAQIAQWLGVTIKQVKYLEHDRRNPSGPTSRLLSILAAELHFESPFPVQVLGASVPKRLAGDESPSPSPETAKTQAEERTDQQPISQTQPDQDPISDSGAFVWQ
ncbi:MAG TPA: helix-turn-helix domain-containing protein [Verrucomicrobiae bacterium]|nr:helix-turn-helix domain-containing protein [Verrucomicrobiae bacterium]